MKTKYLKAKFLALALCALWIQSPSQASVWSEFLLHSGHVVEMRPMTAPVYSGEIRLSYTTEFAPPTYGNSYGVRYAGRMYIEVANQDHGIQCRQAVLESSRPSGLLAAQYFVRLHQDASGKCWGEISSNDTRISLENWFTTNRNPSYAIVPVGIQDGDGKWSQKLYLHTHHGVAVYSIRLP